MECLDLDLNLRDLEPFYGQLALFDVRQKRRISENFYFQLNKQDTLAMLAAKEAFLKQAIFTVSHDIEDVFIVLRIEKVLEGKLSPQPVKPAGEGGGVNWQQQEGD